MLPVLDEINASCKLELLKDMSYVMILLGLLLACFGIFIFHRKKKTARKDNDDIDRLLREFQPEPIVPACHDPDQLVADKCPIVNGKVSFKTVVDGVECINLVSGNFLNLVTDERIEQNSIETIEKYGVGSCGPRGFYGTVVVHLNLEERISKFMNTEESIVYSYAFSTISSTIPAYCKRSDLIFCDEQVSDAAKTGLTSARSKVVYFKHNNVADLEEKIIQNTPKTRNNKKKNNAKLFLVVEGLYGKTGNICNLPGLIKIRKKYKLRMILDESFSIGVLGGTGRGVVEHFHENPADIDIITGSLENLIGSVGGFCTGSSFIIEHQRLSGTGYCFSASLPPCLTTAAYTAFEYLDANPQVFDKLRSRCTYFSYLISKIDFLKVYGDAESPIKYLEFDTEYPVVKKKQYMDFKEMVRAKGVIVQLCHYSCSNNEPNMCVKICMNVAATDDDLKHIFFVLFSCATRILRDLCAY